MEGPLQGGHGLHERGALRRIGPRGPGALKHWAMGKGQGPRARAKGRLPSRRATGGGMPLPCPEHAPGVTFAFSRAGDMRGYRLIDVR